MPPEVDLIPYHLNLRVYQAQDLPAAGACTQNYFCAVLCCAVLCCVVRVLYSIFGFGSLAVCSDSVTVSYRAPMVQLTFAGTTVDTEVQMRTTEPIFNTQV